MFRRIAGQVKASPTIIVRADSGVAMSGGAYGLDYGAVITFADKLGALTPLFIELLPEIEAIIVRSYRAEAQA